MKKDGLDALHRIEEVMGLEFSADQRRIIEHRGRPANVISCAGSGKTTLMLAMVCYNQMVYGVDGSGIIVLTFNKSAADEIEGKYLRLSKELGLSDRVTFKTYHALYYMILKYFYHKEGKEMHVMGDMMATSLFNDSFYEHSRVKRENVRDDMLGVRGYVINNLIVDPEVLRHDSIFQRTGVNYEDYMNVVKGYRELKSEGDEELMDFDDLQIEMLRLVRDNEEAREMIRSAWDYWYVDEYQDISKVQLEILKLCVPDYNNLVTIGDEDQAIYEFRGSKVDYIVDFPLHFQGSRRYLMGTNYRCPNVILDKAGNLIEQNKYRIDKDIRAYREGGELVYGRFEKPGESAVRIGELIDRDIRSGVDPQDIVVLYRNTYQQLFIVDNLLSRGVPVDVRNTNNLLHNHRVVNDIVNIIEFSMDDASALLFSKVFTKITAYVSRREVNNFYMEISKGVPWREVVLPHYGGSNGSIVKASKVLEEIRDMVMSGSTMDELVDKVMGIYSNHLKYIQEVGGYDVSELVSIIGYIKMVGSDKTFKQFRYYLDRSKSTISFYKDVPNTVKLNTMHTVKGLEYDHVYIIDVLDHVLPDMRRFTGLCEAYGDVEGQDYMEQERRLMYVAMTRAKKRLYISYVSGSESPFIYEQLSGFDVPYIGEREELVIDSSGVNLRDFTLVGDHSGEITTPVYGEAGVECNAEDTYEGSADYEFYGDVLIEGFSDV